MDTVGDRTHSDPRLLTIPVGGRTAGSQTLTRDSVAMRLGQLN